MVEEKVLGRIDLLIEKGNQVLSTHRENPPNIIGGPTLDTGVFTEWKTQSLSFLDSMLGKSHPYFKSFEDEVKYREIDDVKKGQGILKALREDISGGYLSDIKTLVSSEVFSDFLDMAYHLIENKYKDPAASLCGAVLEDGLRRIAKKANITVKSKDDVSSLNQKCADAMIYNRLMQKKLQVYTDIRNNADHGHFVQYTQDDVIDMHKGISAFLVDYLK